jgi:hypothetical protein
VVREIIGAASPLVDDEEIVVAPGWAASPGERSGSSC